VTGEDSKRVSPSLWTEVRGHGARVVFLHGFTQAGASWNPVLQACADLHAEVLLPDLPGHGRSASTTLNLNDTADVVAATFGPAFYVGYSMGGRLALNLAVRHPNLVRGLLLFGATAGLATETERTQRCDADELLAQNLEATGVPTFLQRWLSNPMFATLPHDPEGLLLRQQNTIAGLASSLRLSGTGSQDSLWDKLETVRVPTIIAAGDRDEKFTAIGQQMTTRIGPCATFTAVTNAGHSCHLEQPQQAAGLIKQMLINPAEQN
jgi:2-succinyl-6-hydroxy-2,4-cyclohexadiene-1-carboxylate synthase